MASSAANSPDLWPQAEPLSRAATPFDLRNGSSHGSPQPELRGSPRPSSRNSGGVPPSRDVARNAAGAMARKSTRPPQPHGLTPISRPPSRASTPLAQILNLPGHTDATEDAPFVGSLGDAQGDEEQDDGEQGTERTAGPPAWADVLPKKTSLSEAEPALAKINRIQAAKDQHRKWMKLTGAAAIVKSKASSKRRGNDGGGEEGSPRDSHDTSELKERVADGDESVGPVKLGITSIPGYSVLAVKGVAGKTRDVVHRRAIGSKRRLFRAHSPSSQVDDGYAEEEEEEEEGEEDHETVSRNVTRTWSRDARESQRKSPLGFSRSHRPTPSLDGQALAAMGVSGPATEQGSTTYRPFSAEHFRNSATVGASRRPSVPTVQPVIAEERTTDLADSPAGQLTAAPAETSRRRDDGTQSHPQEDAEEPDDADQADQTMLDKGVDAACANVVARPERPRINIPTLHVQEPSLQSIQTEHSSSKPMPRGQGAVRPVALRGALSFDAPENAAREDPADDSKPRVEDALLPSQNNKSLVRPWVMSQDNGDPSELVASPIGEDSSASTSSMSSSEDLSSLPDEDSDKIGSGGYPPRDTTEDFDLTVDSIQPDDDAVGSVSLQHGRPLTNKELRAQLKRDKALPKQSVGKAAHLGHRVSRGLHYASSERRNRRAMDKFSPHPNAPSSTTLDRNVSNATRQGSITEFGRQPPVNRANTELLSGFQGGWDPNFTLSRQSRSTTLGQAPSKLSVLEAGAEEPRPSNASQRSSLLGGPDLLAKASSPPLERTSLESFGDDSLLHRITSLQSRRWSTHRSTTSPFQDGAQSRDGANLAAPRPWHFRQRRKWAQEQADESQVGSDGLSLASPRLEDPEDELDKVLGKLAADQSPEQLGEKYEWDVLYENQRGLLFFGIPKFSARTLMQWDPSPWTNGRFENSPYNIVNAQLPDPNWEWVYPEFLIDMSADVDEQGWQYSGNFGRNPFAGLHHRFTRPLPKNGPDGDAEVSSRLQRKAEKRSAKEARRADDGLEALKRSIKAKGSKWTGRPDPGSFVRRRRWIRLRRRKALCPVGAPSQGAGESETQPARTDDDVVAQDDSSSSSSSPGCDSEESEMEEEDEESSENGYTSPYDKASGFLPRRTAGHLQQGDKAAEFRKTHRPVKMSRRHRREFTGTLRELKTLLPSLIDPTTHIHPHHYQHKRPGERKHLRDRKDLILTTIDARNPFISWQWVRKRLADDDMGWKTTALRQMERKHQQRTVHASRTSLGRPGRPSWPAFDASPPVGGNDAAANGASSSVADDALRRQLAVDSQRLDQPFTTPDDRWVLTRDALVEINFGRVKRVLRACKVDRQRLELWKLWLRLEVPDWPCFANMDRKHCTLDINSQELVGSGRRPSTSSTAPARNTTRAGRLPASQNRSLDLNDVWDVLERRLDAVLFLFEFNSSRAALLRILLSVHDESHAHHRYRNDHSWKLADFEGHPVRITAPRTLDPRLAPVKSEHLGSGSSRFIARDGDWVVGMTSRLQFFSDVQSVAEQYLDDHQQQQKHTQHQGSHAGLEPAFDRAGKPTSPPQTMSRMAAAAMARRGSNSPLGSQCPYPSEFPRGLGAHSPAASHRQDLGLAFGPGFRCDETTSGRQTAATSVHGGDESDTQTVATSTNNLYWQQHQQHRLSPFLNSRTRHGRNEVDSVSAAPPSSRQPDGPSGADESSAGASPSMSSRSSPAPPQSVGPIRSRSPLGTTQWTAQSFGETQQQGTPEAWNPTRRSHEDKD
ncbi:unnamed protein product [Parajaminaea phylloscopi]